MVGEETASRERNGSPRPAPAGRQRTIAGDAEIAGFGFFSGEDVRLRFKPARPNSGIVFLRREGDQPPVRIPVDVQNVAKKLRRTSLKTGNLSVDTTEHCLAAVAGLGIDNLLIEIDAAELPGIDGSSIGFVECLRGVGLVDQDADRTPFVITKPVHVAEGDALLAAIPGLADELTLTYSLDLRGSYGPDCPIRPMTYTFKFSEKDFIDEVAPSRTWLLEQEVEYMRSQGLGLRVSEKDVLVMGRHGPVGNTLRYADELVRHKVLDLLGDLYLLGRPLRGTVFARGSGHSMNHELVRRLLAGADEERRQPTAPAVLDVRQLQRILPHRYPFLMVDRVLELEGARAVGIKNVTINEHFFQGHYPGTPVMPGVLIVEALAQLAGVLLLRRLEHTGKVAYLVALDKVKFRRPVVPGDQLVLEADANKMKTRSGNVTCRALVAGKPVAEAELTFMLADADPV